MAEAELETPISMNIIRGEARRALSVTLTERDDGLPDEEEEEAPPALFAGSNAYGLLLLEIDEDARRRWQIPSPVQGALIDMVDPEGPSYGHLQKGDVITEIAFQSVTSPVDANEIFEEEGGSDPLLVKVLRHGRYSFYALQLES